MITDRDVTGLLRTAMQQEQTARSLWVGTTDVPDRDNALIAIRHATALRKSLETWIAMRALRAERVTT